ncbi:MAG: response regulator [Phycisphaerales bacterium]|nr:response regulator [Phycisphaerales bacterium]
MTQRTILLADDEPHITHIVAHKLNKIGINVLIAEDGEIAYQMAVEHKPDAIVTDLQMPYMSGIELADKLNRNAELSKIPIILLSARGYAIADQTDEYPNIRHVLSKPFSTRDLIQQLISLMDEDENRKASA